LGKGRGEEERVMVFEYRTFNDRGNWVTAQSGDNISHISPLQLPIAA
jgi:hypothetical protein